MTTIEKIRKVLIDKGIVNTNGKHKGKPNLSKAEQEIGVSPGTLSKAFKRKDGDLHPSNQEKFIVKFHVRREWWETGLGDIFEEKAQKVTPVTKQQQVEEQPNWVGIVNSLQRLIDDQDARLEKLTRELEDCKSRKVIVN